jgi:hypothetical protein
VLEADGSWGRELHKKLIGRGGGKASPETNDIVRTLTVALATVDILKKYEEVHFKLYVYSAAFLAAAAM